MALTRFGDTGPVFGLVAETTGFAQTFHNKMIFDEAMVDNNVGETVTYGLYNQHWEGQLVLIEKSSDTLPTPGTAIVAANLSNTYGDTTKVIIHAYERTPEQKGFQKHTFDFKAFVNISP